MLFLKEYRAAIFWTILVMLVSVALAWQFIPDYFSPEAAGGDYHRYETMMVQLWPNQTMPPWRYRIMYPLLARIPHAMGASNPVSFFWVTMAACFASCLVFRRFLLLLGFGKEAALIGLLVFAATAGVVIPARQYSYPDALMNLFTLIILVYILEKRILAIAVTMTLAVFAKDSIVMLLPLVFVWVPRSRQLKNIILLLVPPAIVFIALRLIFYTEVLHSYFSADNISILLGYWQIEMSKGPVRWVLGALAFSLGPLWLMAFLGIRGNRLFILKTLPYTILIFLPLAFTADTERALCMYAPIVIPLAMCPLQAAAQDRKLLPLWGGLFVILVFASQAIFYIDSSYVKYTMFPGLALAGFGLSWWAARNRSFSMAAGASLFSR